MLPNLNSGQIPINNLNNCRYRHPPEKTVQDHIRLLRQYNKIKDVGQQLIGLIAENRGISVGSLYGRGDYSVDPDD